jgi:hypothetical protein
MCGLEHELNTSPQKMETNYVRFIGMISYLDKDLSIQALCPECAGFVGRYIRTYSNRPKDNNNKKENRVSTIR